MALLKSNSCFCGSTNKMAGALKALGHPVRLRLVQELLAHENCNCAELCNCFPQSQSTISQHLSVLKNADIVSFEKNGNKSCFSLNHDALQELQMVFEALSIQKTRGSM